MPCVALRNKKLSIGGKVDLGIIEKLAKKKLKRKPQIPA
jgi:coenzyme F420 hydrogenase subunit beta